MIKNRIDVRTISWKILDNMTSGFKSRVRDEVVFFFRNLSHKLQIVNLIWPLVFQNNQKNLKVQNLKCEDKMHYKIKKSLLI